MTVQGTRWVLPLAFTVLATLVGGTSRARAADDVRPPTLVCVDGLLNEGRSPPWRARAISAPPLALRRRRTGERRVYLRASLSRVLRVPDS